MIQGSYNSSITRFALLSALIVLGVLDTHAGFFYPGITPATVNWPGGVVPYEFDPAVSSHLHQIYIDGLKEWELAGDITFIPRTAETNYVILRYDPFAGINSITGRFPTVMQINSLARNQVVHEMGHGLGLEHEHVRPDRDTFINVLTNNRVPGVEFLYNIVTNGTPHGVYDVESIMHYARNLFSIDPANLNVMEAKPPNEALTPRIGSMTLSPGDRAAAAFLYGPGPALTSIVTTTSDGGTGSLRAAMFYALDHPPCTITFNISTNDPGYSNGVFTIRLSGNLPPLARPGITIDATTQPGYSNHPVVEISGESLLSEAGMIYGLVFYSSNCTVRGLGIKRFPNSGIAFLYTLAAGNRIERCHIGVDGHGVTAEPNAFQGVLIVEQAHHNIIGGENFADRNVISGNAQYGIVIAGTNANSNVIQGNIIGLQANGTNAGVANGVAGIGLFDQTKYNVIGASNVISGNEEYGVIISGSGTEWNVVSGSFVGTDRSGLFAAPNTFAGVALFDRASNNSVVSNLLSGNGSYGLQIAGIGTTGTLVMGNAIGVDITGAQSLANTYGGVGIYASSSGNTIGPGNVISGNGNYGLLIADAGTMRHTVRGNIIGADASGMAAVPNTFGGVLLVSAASDNVFGGSGAGEGNLISGNGGSGIVIVDSNTSFNTFEGNMIGADITGVNALPNAGNGFYLADGAASNVIGGTGAGQGNTIAFSPYAGFYAAADAGQGNAIRGNSFFSNAYLAIDLDGGTNIFYGATANDPGDGDTGPNHLQNYPLLTNVVIWGPATVMQGVLQSRPSRVYEIDFYRNDEADFIGFGEGQYFLGHHSVTTDAGGLAEFSFGVYGTATGTAVSATATDMTTCDTSEFAFNMNASAALVGPPEPDFFNINASTNGVVLVSAELNAGWPYRMQMNSDLLSPAWSNVAGFISVGGEMNLVTTNVVDSALFLRFVSP